MTNKITVGDISLSVSAPQEIKKLPEDGMHSIGSFTFHEDMDQQSVEAQAKELLQFAVDRLAAIQTVKNIHKEQTTLSRLRSKVMLEHGWGVDHTYTGRPLPVRNLIDSLVEIEQEKTPKPKIQQELPEEGLHHIYHKFMGLVLAMVKDGKVYRLERTDAGWGQLWELHDITEGWKFGYWVLRTAVNVKELGE